jgi:hypothetical protein
LPFAKAGYFGSEWSMKKPLEVDGL